MIDKIAASSETEEQKYMKHVGEVLDMRGLLDHPGWLALKAHFERGAQNFERSLAVRLMQGERVSASEIDFHRGAHQVAKEIFARPDTALEDLTATAQRLFAQQASEELAAEQVQSLYIDDKE